jgi:hypothetical protein
VSNGVRDEITSIKDEVARVGDEVAPLWRNGVANPRKKRGTFLFKNPPQMKLLQVVGLGG